MFLHPMVENETALPRLAPDSWSGDVHEVVDRRRLVYLSPDARKPLETVSPDRVYVIAGVCQDPAGPVSSVKADKLRIECRRFPVQENVKLHRGRYQMTLNNVLGVLNDVNVGVSWKDTLTEHMNIRFLREEPDPLATMKSKQLRQQTHEVKQMLPPVVGDGKVWRLREELLRTYVWPFRTNGKLRNTFGGGPGRSPPLPLKTLHAKANVSAPCTVRLVGNEYVLLDDQTSSPPPADGDDCEEQHVASTG